MMTPIILICLTCHVFIQFLWTVTSKGRNIESFFGTWTNVRSIPIVLFEILGFIQLLMLPRLTFPYDLGIPHVEELGLLIAVFGTILASWAKITMGTSWGRPAQHDKSTQSRLIMTGPFSFTRNPIYVGLMMLFFGQQVALQSYGIVLILFFGLAVRRAVQTEEKLLRTYFGQRYASYIKRVPRFL